MSVAATTLMPAFPASPEAGVPSARVHALSRNDRHYRWLLDYLRGVAARRRPEAALQCVSAIAYFATYQHAGRFADGSLENVALAVGAGLAGEPAAVRAD